LPKYHNDIGNPAFFISFCRRTERGGTMETITLLNSIAGAASICLGFTLLHVIIGTFTSAPVRVLAHPVPARRH
jgi:hypothetical protein